MSVSAEVSATCNAVGYYNEQEKKYYADENTLETVKDLIRYLKRDDDKHDIRRQLGSTKVLVHDLLPLIKSYWEETELFDVTLRLLMNLTTPPLILWNEEIPTNRAMRNVYMLIEEHLQNYKESFVDDTLWSVLSSRLTKILEKDSLERDEDSNMIIERILILIRNILYVPADRANERIPDNEATTHDMVAWSMHQSGILDIMLYMSCSVNEKMYHVYILEILFHLFRDVNATELGKTELERSHAERLKDETELMAIRHKEAIKRQQKSKIYTGARHSRFGGTYVVKSMKSISENHMIYHKPLSKLEAISFDADKQKPKTPKNRLPLHMESTERRSAFSIRLCLKQFCIEFLNGAYNSLMYNVKDQLVRAKSQSHDASYFLWAVRFFMEFNRAYKFEVKFISETMSVQAFHYVQQNMENYFDLIETDKKKVRRWSRRLHIALLAYRELLLTLCMMDKSRDEMIRNSSKVIKSNIYYVLEYRELVMTLLLTFDELKMSDQYLKDLIETQHIFLRSFEAFCKDGAVIVQKKTKTKRKKKAAVVAEVPRFDLEHEWDVASQQVSSVLESNVNIPSDVVPFDAASEVPIEEQKTEAMIKIQRKLRNGDYENGIGLLRAARDVWPENDCFGSSHMSPEEEFAALRDIFMADLGENNPPVQEQPIYDNMDNEEDEEDEGTIFSEGDLKFEDFVKRLAHPKIVRAACLALAKFEENSFNTNHCIVKLLHRIAFDCKMYVMLFQVSVFCTFRKIYALKEMPEYKELIKFMSYVLRQFFKIAEKNDNVFMESLFWKSSKDAFDIEYGYGSYTEKNKAAASAWTEVEEDEVRRLFMEHTEKQIEGDVVDWVLANLIDNTRTRRGVLKKMKELYLLTDYKKKVRNTSRLPKQWSQEEEEDLADLYEQFKDAMDPLGCIIDRLSIQRPKNRIIEKLLVLGLIQDRKEVRKKRAKGGSGRSRHNSEQSDASVETDAFSDDDDGPRQRADFSRTREPSKVRKNTSRKANTLVTASSADLIKMTLEISQSGRNDALEWLKDSLSDAIEDYEDDNDEGIPLVPIMDFASQAMENAEFLTLLKGMGIAPPFDEQETYWRIPSNMNLKALKSHQELLMKAIEGTLVIPENANSQSSIQNSITSESHLNNEESSDEDVFDHLRRIQEIAVDKEIGDSVTERTQIIDRKPRKSQQTKKNYQSKITEREISMNINEEDIIDKNGQDKNIDESIRMKKRKRMVFIDDSSNDSVDSLQETTENVQESNDNLVESNQSKRRRPSSSFSNPNEDILDTLEEELEKKAKRKKVTKKPEKKMPTEKKSRKKKESKSGNELPEKKSVKKGKEFKTNPQKVFLSKEFLSSDSSTDDEEASNNLQEYYNKLLQKDSIENDKKRDVVSTEHNTSMESHSSENEAD